MVAILQAAESARWDDIRVYLAVFRERNLAAAGARLALDASTVSRRLVALEEVLGARLFDRLREGLVPTHAAELLFAPAEEMEAGHLRFAREASGLERAPEGVVRLSVPPGVAEAFLAPRLPALLARHPRIRLAIDASVRVLDLTRREADLALRTIRPVSGDLVMTKVTTTPWIAMTSPAYAEELGRVRAWDEARWIGWGEDLASIGPARWLARHAPKVEPVLRTSHFATQLAAAEAGLGVALVSAPYAAVREIVPLRLARALELSATEWPSDDLWLVGHRALREVPRVAAVWDFLLAELGAPVKPARGQKKRPRG